MNKIKLVESISPAEKGEMAVSHDNERALINKTLVPYISKAKKGQITDDDMQNLLKSSLIKFKYQDYTGEDDNEFVKSLENEFKESVLTEAPEDEEQIIDDTPQDNKVDELAPPEEDEMVDDEDAPNELIDEPEDSELDFITSDELNEIRDVLLDIPDDIQLLLLDDKLIVFGEVIDTVTYLYTLMEDSNEFEKIEMSNELENILANPLIIKYTQDGPDERHQQVMSILMNKLNDDSAIDTQEDIIDEPIEEPVEEEVIPDEEKQD